MSDLDDFFAKKSKKKKSKTSSAVLAGDLLNQKKEQEVRKARKLKEKDEKSTEPLSTLLKKTEEDDEWNDMETEREPTAADLSKIQNLTISRDTEPLRDSDDRNNGGNEGEDTTREEGDRSTAAWGFSSEANAGNQSDNDTNSTHSGGVRDNPALPTASQPPAHSTEIEEPSRNTSSAGQAYVPPHLRGRSEFTVKQSIKKAVKAPDIGNVEEFPSLGGAPGGEEQDQRDMQPVRSSGAPRIINSGGKPRGYSDNSSDNWRRGDRSSHNSHFGGRMDGGRSGGRSDALVLENRYSTLSEDY